MSSKSILIFLNMLLLISISVTPVFAEADRPVLLQAFIGAAKYNDDSLTFKSTTAGEDIQENLSEMPIFGVIAQYPLSLGNTQFGVEGGGIIGWRSRKTSIYSTENGIQIKVKASLWIFDLSCGPYVSQKLGDNWRIYAAAGPTMLFASYREDREPSQSPYSANDSKDNSSDQFGVGGYARIGIDYQISPGAYVGIGSRAVISTLEFDSQAANEELSGVQGFLTFSREF